MSRSACYRATLAVVTLFSASLGWAQAQVKPRFHVIVDTSSSMLWTPEQTATFPEGVWTHGDGSLENPGCDVNGDGLTNDSKLYQAKSALYNVVAAYGEVEFALESFEQGQGGVACGDTARPCAGPGDCGGFACVSNYCRQPVGAGCPEAAPFNVGGYCMSCRVGQTDCQPPNVCDNGTCRLAYSTDPSTECPTGSGATGFCHSCLVPEDCSVGFACTGQRCLKLCSIDDDCPDQQNCVAGVCAPTTFNDWTCTYTGTPSYPYQVMHCPSACNRENYVQCTSSFDCGTANCSISGSSLQCTDPDEDPFNGIEGSVDLTCDGDPSPLDGTKTIGCSNPDDNQNTAQACVFYNGYDRNVACLANDACFVDGMCTGGICDETAEPGFDPASFQCACTSDADCVAPQRCVYDPDLVGHSLGPNRCRYTGSGKVLVPFPDAGSGDNMDAVLSWIDNHEYDYYGETDRELRGSGRTPLEASLTTARNSLLTDVLPFDELKRPCRSYNVILLTDGAETCGGDAVPLAEDLSSNLWCDGGSCCCRADPNVPFVGAHPGCDPTCLPSGANVSVKVWVVGFAICPGGGTACAAADELNNIAIAGGTTQAYFVEDQVQLQAILAEIIANSIPVELCNGIDDNCNDLIDEDWPNKGESCTVGVGECENDGTIICAPSSVDPERRSTCCGTGDPDGGGECIAPLPDSTEVCDGLDNDCDGQVDEDFADLGTLCSLGYGECKRYGLTTCNPGDTTQTCCDDPATPEPCDVVAGAPSPEICDGKDNDCDCLDDNTNDDGVICGPGDVNVDEDPLSDVGGNCFVEEDGTPFTHGCDVGAGTCLGECELGSIICQGQGGPTVPQLVCSNAVGPATEICDGLDNNCNDLYDELWPEKGAACSVGLGECRADGTYICHPTDNTKTCCGNGSVCVTAGTGTTEVCDGTDNDCDGRVDESHGDPDELGQQCYDLTGNPGVGPCEYGTKICGPDGTGSIGLVCFGQKGPQLEMCDDIDNDCDNELNESHGDPDQLGTSCYTFSSGTPGLGPCQAGLWTCPVNSLVCDGEVGPSAELCDAIDNDCDGTNNEDFPLLGQPCNNGEVGICYLEGVFVCTGDGLGVECNALPGTSETEICDGIDNDCDGLVDETHNDPDELGTECNDDPTNTGMGECRFGVVVCVETSPGVWGIECANEVGPSPEVCDGLDNDCDCPGDTNGDDVVCGPGDTNVDEDFADPGYTNLGPLGTACDNAATGACYRTGVFVCNEAGDGTVCDAPPGIPSGEICDGIDNDCDCPNDDTGNPDGIICGPGDINVDEDIPNDGTVPCSSAVGECVPGYLKCINGDWVCDGGTLPTPELCDGADNNCNGVIDDRPTIDEGDKCYEQPDGTPYTTGCDLETEVCRGECRIGAMVCTQLPEPAGATLVCEGAVGPVPEICNLLDEDCDGVPDNLATCPVPGDICWEGDCVSPCLNDEFPCDAGNTCFDVSGGAGALTLCTQPGVDPDCYCLPSLCAGVTCDPGSRCDLLTGECVNPCDSVTCQEWEQCQNGQCYDCNTFGCGECERCVGNRCQVDPCCEITCNAGQYCNALGECQDLCTDEDCGHCEKCAPDGTGCVADLCCETQCALGSFCDPETGDCVIDPCTTIICPAGFACSKILGECIADPCASVSCGTCQKCWADLAVDPPTAQCIRDPDPSCATGPRVYITAQGGGCAAAPGGPGDHAPPWLLLLLLVGLPVARLGRKGGAR